jgi:HlyD family secretion protein
MKTVYLTSLALFVTLTGCNNKEKTDAYGNFTSTEIIVSAESSGKVLVKNTEEGDKIGEGDLIYVIDTLQNSLKRTELDKRKNSIISKTSNFSAQIEVFQQQKKSMETDQIRIKAMIQDGAATKKQLDDITNQLSIIDKQIRQVGTNFAGVQAEIESIDAQIAQISDIIERSKVKSPVKGTILETYAEKGESISAGKPLFKVADLDVMELKAYFSGNQLPLLKIGSTVKVMVDNGEGGIANYEGIISWISSESEFTPKIIQTREERINLVYAVKIRVKNDGSLKINMPGEVKL